MTVGKDTIWHRFLEPIIRPLINEKEMSALYQSIDWEQVKVDFTNPQINYPTYYSSRNFHGIERGYLNPGAAVSYDPITQYVLPPGETWVRQGLIDQIGGQPRSILDLGCGTGSSTILLKQAFPGARVVGLDLSPYMLFIAARKAEGLGLEIEWRHGLAESTGLLRSSFDLVTANLLFHETPPGVTKLILQEAWGLLKPGGQIVVLDGNQASLRQNTWLTEIFEEPYIQDYGQGNLDAWLGWAGFKAVQTTEWWWIHQISQGMKPQPISDSLDFEVEYYSPAIAL